MININVNEVKKEDLEKISSILKVISHSSRLCILFKLLRDGECNVTKMQNCLCEPQSTVSQHVSKLKSAGIIEGKRKGTEIIYKITDEEIIKILKALI